RDTGKCVLSAGWIGTDDRNDPGPGPIGRQFEAVLVRRIEAVIRAGIDLHLDRGAAPDRAIEKGFARRGRRPYILGAHQHEKREAAGPVRWLPLDIAGAGVERDSGAKIALRQGRRPAEAAVADREQRRAAALRPAHEPDAVA